MAVNKTVGQIIQINASEGGVPKRSIASSEVTSDGLTSDKQRDLEHHGGPRQKLCLFRLENIVELQREGHPIFPGSVGENITTFGLDAETIQPGVRLRLGTDVAIELTDFAPPCKTISGSFSDGNFNRINEIKHPSCARIYARVLSPGTIRPGDKIEVI